MGETETTVKLDEAAVEEAVNVVLPFMSFHEHDRRRAAQLCAEALQRAGLLRDMATSGRVDAFREDCEQVVTDILFALDLVSALDVNDGPGVDDAREAVMDELVSAFGPKPAGGGAEPKVEAS